tara:strand:+ start:1241 stop:1411 length:171 start_codon:yes stop_codon:yes gene_type:complete
MPTVKVRGKKVKLPYNKAGKSMAAKLKKKKKKKSVSGEDYGQIPTNNGTENPVGGN